MDELKGFKAAVIATDGFEESELTEPVKALKQAGATVEVVSLKPGEIQGFKHHDKSQRIKVDRTLQEVKTDNYDGLVLPGGALNADTMRMVPEAKAFVATFDRMKKPIAAICHAPWILISAGVVKGRALAAYHTIQDDIRNAGGTWHDKELVQDQNWVTSRQPSDLPAFNAAMIRLFAQSRARQPAAR